MTIKKIPDGLATNRGNENIDYSYSNEAALPRQIVLPHSVEAEQAVIGGLIIDNSTLGKIELEEKHFFRPEHRVIFTAIAKLAELDKPFDMITIAEFLKNSNSLNSLNVGGEAYLFEMARNIPSTANINAYANIVKDRWLRRAMIFSINQIRADDTSSVISSLQTLITKHSQMSVAHKLKVISVQELLTSECKERENILKPIITTQSINMLHSYRGVGKTHVSLGIAFAVASGGNFLRWNADKPRRVLFLDGEMPQGALKERVALLAETSGQTAMPLLDFITPDVQECNLPDLGTNEGQAAIEHCIQADTELIIVDNLSCWARCSRENEAEGWQPLQTWALNQRRKGRSILFVHHSGKSGQQRGTSKREDVLDNVIHLKHPVDYQSLQGARFEISFEKARGLLGEDTATFEAQLIEDATGKQQWAIKSLELSNHERIVGLFKDGLTQADIAKELGINKSTVSRHINTAKSNGEI